MASANRLSSLLERFRVRPHLFHAGRLCGDTRFAAEPGRGFLHVLQRGEMVLTHQARSGAPRHIKMQQPSVIFYPRPLEHVFHNAPADGCDFCCAVVDFEGGVAHPLARALPPLVVVPLAQLPQLEHTLALLFAETEQLRCGHRLLANRLFEVLLLQLLRWLLDHPQESGMPAGLSTGLSHPQLAQVLVALHEQPGRGWTLPLMAEQAGMSRSAFAAAFKTHVGQGPADYLAQWRLSIAQSQLRRGTSLKMAAQSLGYSSASALSRAFAQKVGMSPRQWLKESA